MARVIDITSKIKNEKVFFKIGDKSYTVDKSADTLLEILEMQKTVSADVENDQAAGLRLMYDIIKKLLGSQALEDMRAMKLDVNDLSTYVNELMNAAIDADEHKNQKKS